jgi:UrcA family protein
MPQQREIDMSKMFAAAGALLAAATLVVSTASQAETSNSVHVSYADLNLASPAGQGVLQRRIAGAARVVCVIEDSREIALRTATDDCRSDAVARAWPAYQAAVGAARRGSVTVLDGAALTITAY